nr:MAG TPA: hypothetical protein [Caudoviricetes sp.]
MADPLKFRKVQSLITLRSRYKQQSSDLDQVIKRGVSLCDAHPSEIGFNLKNHRKGDLRSVKLSKKRTL